MAFRNDLDAAHARADALERKLADTEAENERLKAGELIPRPAAAPVLRPSVVLPVMVGGCAVLGIGWLAFGTVGLAVGGAAAVALTLPMLLVARLVEVVGPGEVLVISGPNYPRPDGRNLGYRVIKSGRVLRRPLIETAERMSVRAMTVDVRVEAAYTKGSIPVALSGAAVVRVIPDEPEVINAVERFLGRPQTELMRVAKATVEGQLRGVLADLTIAEIQENPSRFAESLIHECEDDMAKMGLAVDSFNLGSLDVPV